MASERFTQDMYDYMVDYYEPDEIEQMTEEFYMALDGLGPDEGIDAIDPDVFIDMTTVWDAHHQLAIIPEYIWCA